MLLPVNIYSALNYSLKCNNEVYQSIRLSPQSVPIAIPIARYGPNANFDSPLIRLFMMPQIAAIIIPANAETIIARVPITLPAQNIRSVSPSSMPRISSPLRFFITALLISPIIKNGTLMHKAPIILSVISSESVKICEGIERKRLDINFL